MTPVPQACVLDPHGGIAHLLARTGRARRDTGWGVFHTELWTARISGVEVGIVTAAVGAPWAVLVAGRLARSGCRVLVSIAPALPVDPPRPPPCVVLIDRALRDAPSGAHQQPDGGWSHLAAPTAARLSGAFDHLPVVRGSSWTTSAPHRTPAMAFARTPDGPIACVETEAAGLYGAVPDVAVACLAHLDDATTVDGPDVVWGPGIGTEATLDVVTAAVTAMLTPARPTGSTAALPPPVGPAAGRAIVGP